MTRDPPDDVAGAVQLGRMRVFSEEVRRLAVGRRLEVRRSAAGVHPLEERLAPVRLGFADRFLAWARALSLSIHAVVRPVVPGGGAWAVPGGWEFSV